MTGEVREPGAGSAGAEARSRARHAAPDPADPNDAAQPLRVDLSAAELDLARQEAAERTADLQRVTAEYANYRKRVDRDRESVVTAAKAGVVLELLTVLDDLDRARAHGDLVGSFGAVADRLTGALTKLGLWPGSVRSAITFDPAVHEAVQFGTSTEVTEPTVTAVFRSGYTLGEKLVRPAVVVVTGPEHEVRPASSSRSWPPRRSDRRRPGRHGSQAAGPPAVATNARSDARGDRRCPGMTTSYLGTAPGRPDSGPSGGTGERKDVIQMTMKGGSG